MPIARASDIDVPVHLVPRDRGEGPAQPAARHAFRLYYLPRASVSNARPETVR